MPPPVAVYVVAAVVGVAALFAFKEFVYEPHLAPKIEAWAEDFLERRRAARASAVPVNSSRRRRNSTSSSGSSHPEDGNHEDWAQRRRERGPNELPIDEFELEALAAREVDEWRNEVLRSQGREGLRRRRLDQPKEDFDGFDSTTLDESFTSLTRTPLAYVISNISSPDTSGTVSLPQTPSRRPRSESQSTTTQVDSNPGLNLSYCSIHESSAMLQRPGSPVSADVVAPPPTVGEGHPVPSSLAISNAVSPAAEAVPHPLPFTPTYIMADDSPFGPLLPETPRSSAEIYGERPFSPITRVMGSSGSMSVSGSRSSRANSLSSLRTLAGSGVRRRGSGLVNEVVVAESDDDSDEKNRPPISTPNFSSANSGTGMNESVVSSLSLSERYPAPPTPPVVISPPSSIGVISAPSSPSSGSSEVVVHVDGLASPPHSPSQPPTIIHPSLPSLQLPSDPPSSGQISRSRSQVYSAMSPSSYVSFLSPLPLSRAASESEGDEFLSVASDDSEWDASPVTPGGVGPVPDRENNPFLDFEDLAPRVRRNGSEHSEDSEVLVPNVGREGGSEVGSDESWGSARRH